MFPIAMRYGMTIGELAAYFNGEFGLGAKLEVVQMPEWSRDTYGDETGLPWVPPSPNIPTVDTAVVYPGTVLLEGTNISEGRGTTRPFELVGAPWANPERHRGRLERARAARRAFPARAVRTHVPQARRRALRGLPDSRHRSPVVPQRGHGGRRHRRLSRRRTGPVRVAKPAVRIRATKAPIDILYGSADLRTRLDRGEGAREICAAWAGQVGAFLDIRARYLLY